jgi:hypothetical protein
MSVRRSGLVGVLSGDKQIGTGCSQRRPHLSQSICPPRGVLLDHADHQDRSRLDDKNDKGLKPRAIRAVNR